MGEIQERSDNWEREGDEEGGNERVREREERERGKRGRGKEREGRIIHSQGHVSTTSR